MAVGLVYPEEVAELASMVSLARALLALSRSRRTGVLEVRGACGACGIAVAKGSVRAATAVRGAELTLGDELLRSGDMDRGAHLRALEQVEVSHPVGAWLIAVGVATRAAVEFALREQMRSRVHELFRWNSLQYRFAPGRADVGIPGLAEPLRAADLVLGALRRALAADPPVDLRGTLGEGRLRLTPLGAQLLEQAALWPEEAVLACLLGNGTDLHAISEATGGSERALRMLYALYLLGAIATGAAGERRVSLLLSKRMQVHRADGAAALLDLPAGAEPRQAARALRRLAVRLHPDAFGSDAPPALLRASSEVMAALARAEAEIRRC